MAMRIIAVFAGVSLLTFAAGAQEAPERVERGNLVMEGVPEIPGAVSERLRQYQNVRGASFSGFAGEDGILISTRFGETSQIHHVAEPLGARSQITFYDEPVRGAGYRPETGAAFVFGKDTGGDEFYQGHLFDMASGEASIFTEPETRNGAFAWSRDGGQIAWYRSTADDPDWDILVADPSDPTTRRVVLEGDGAMYPLDWSHDGTQLLVGKYVSITKSHIYVLDLATGELDEVRPGVDVSWGGVEFSRDGASLTAVSDEDSDFQRLMTVDLADDSISVLTPDLTWDIENMDLSPDGRTVVYTINAGGAEELRFYDLETGEDRAGPELPYGLIASVQFDEGGARVGFVLNSATSPSDVWTYDMASGDLTQWTQSEVGGLNRETFLAPELISFPTFDEIDGAAREIPAWVYRPNGAGPHPVIVSIHGGPEGQARPSFSSTYQYWLNELGAAVVVPNVRGSAGYGREYVALDNGMNRFDSVRDIGALLDWIGAQDDLDADRVLVYGGSYGGYMVLASMVEYGERLAGGVDIVGVSNFVTFLENTMGYRRDLRRAEYGDERDPEMRAYLEEIAPSNHADEITIPLFVIQGANDPRVPQSESEQMVAAIREAGGEVWYLLALDEGHGFRKKSNNDVRRAAETMFISEVLGLE